MGGVRGEGGQCDWRLKRRVGGERGGGEGVRGEERRKGRGEGRGEGRTVKGE